MSDASKVKRWQAWVIADEVQRFQPIPEFFVSDEDHDRIVAELKAEVERLRTLVNTLSYRLEYGLDKELEAIEQGEGV